MKQHEAAAAAAASGRQRVTTDRVAECGDGPARHTVCTEGGEEGGSHTHARTRGGRVSLLLSEGALTTLLRGRGPHRLPPSLLQQNNPTVVTWQEEASPAPPAAATTPSSRGGGPHREEGPPSPDGRLPFTRGLPPLGSWGPLAPARTHDGLSWGLDSFTPIAYRTATTSTYKTGRPTTKLLNALTTGRKLSSSLL